MDIQLENYRVEEELGRSGVLTLYRARCQADDRVVLIKTVEPLFADNEAFALRFRYLTKQAAKLDHPHIITSYEATQENNCLYVVQEFPDARPLADVIEAEGPFSPQRMQGIARQIASALDYAHQKSVTHGDLSDRTVYVGPDDYVWVTDFGQAQALADVSLLKKGYTFTTPETLAPERVHGQGPSRYSDLYALGILCYQMLAKKPPFTGPAATVLHAQAYKQPRALYLVNPGIPIPVSEVITRMLAKGVELRYSTGAEFVRALASAAIPPKTQGHGHYYAGPGGGSPRQRVRLKPLAYLGIVTLFLVTATSLVRAGYELGIRQVALPAAPVLPGNGSGVPVSIPTLAAPVQKVTPVEVILPPSPQPTADRLLPTPTPSGYVSLADTLLPTPSPAVPAGPAASTTPAVTLASPSPAASPVLRVIKPAAAATPGPVVPDGQGRLVFTNPTGYDLVVDLTGPASASALVPPHSRQEFTLGPGSYQCIIHTITGKELATRTLVFDVVEGRVIEKDYYTDYDVTAQR